MKHALFLSITILWMMAGCQKELDVQPAGSGNTPQFNFLARLETPTAPIARDTFRIQLYLRHLDFQAPAESYRLLVTLPTTLDGVLYYHSKAFRSEDWIEVPYSDLKEYTTLLKLLPFQYAQGNHTVNLNLTDRHGQAKTASLSIVVP